MFFNESNGISPMQAFVGGVGMGGMGELIQHISSGAIPTQLTLAPKSRNRRRYFRIVTKKFYTVADDSKTLRLLTTNMKEAGSISNKSFFQPISVMMERYHQSLALTVHQDETETFWLVVGIAFSLHNCLSPLRGFLPLYFFITGNQASQVKGTR
ncbi:hypothetical protein PV325_007637 [Microctonus aethiopoides]|nr:hypothetical protein PV325_007637 [Microctonus aethiopoides]